MAKRSLALKRIHISPVGFEIDRIVEPAKMDNADLVYLISHDNLSTDKAKPYVKAIIKRLKSEEGIEAVEKRVNRMDLFEIIKAQGVERVAVAVLIDQRRGEHGVVDRALHRET